MWTQNGKGVLGRELRIFAPPPVFRNGLDFSGPVRPRQEAPIEDGTVVLDYPLKYLTPRVARAGTYLLCLDAENPLAPLAPPPPLESLTQGLKGHRGTSLRLLKLATSGM